MRVLNSAYESFYQDIVFPVYHSLKRDGLNGIYRDVIGVLSISPEEVRKLQESKLRRLLRHSYETVPYYRSYFHGLGVRTVDEITHQSLMKLPLVNKELITKSQNQFVSEKYALNELSPNSTSGSSGTPFRFYTDKNFRHHCAATVYRNHRMANVSLGSRKLWLWGAQIDIKKQNNYVERIKQLLTRKVMLSSYSMSDDDIRQYVTRIRRFRPALITSYPTPLSLVAQYIIKNDVDIDFPVSVITSAEMLYPEQRELIEAAFKTRVFNRYGSREFGDIAQEDTFHNGLRVNSDHVYVEVLDNDGMACPPGVSGELYITGLNNFAMPLIRYKIGDRAAWSQNQIYYDGMPLPLLESIEGRSFEVIEAPNGNRVGGTFWTILLRARGGIRQFQVVQYSGSRICIKYIPDEGFNSGVVSYIKEQVADKCGADMAVEFMQVDEFVLPPNGKHKIIIKASGE